LCPATLPNSDSVDAVCRIGIASGATLALNSSLIPSKKILTQAYAVGALFALGIDLPKRIVWTTPAAHSDFRSP